ncbi:MAG: prolipoprotein diacylglyceryl transferase [Deferrisomatales bacterium]|nr:prolipoprotein diacylglyceryl transferase [Deferrisomatales bacterium]
MLRFPPTEPPGRRGGTTLFYHDFDPVAFRLGPLAVRWYGLAYLAGFAAAYGVLRRAVRRGRLPLEPQAVGDLVTWLALGLVLGARAGYVLFYNLPYFAAHPLRAFAFWEGGMSFHGGLAGVGLAAWLFARRHSLGLLSISDVLALAAPFGLLFGRLANFVNGELYGRVTSLPWGVVFPAGGPLPRHPSQLYEALLQGPILWAWVAWVSRRFPGRTGAATAAFLGGYGVLRILVELVREPDPQLGFLLGPLTMGQLLSAVLVAAGLWLWQRARPSP